MEKLMEAGRQGGEAAWLLLASFDQTDFPKKPNSKTQSTSQFTVKPAVMINSSIFIDTNSLDVFVNIDKTFESDTLMKTFCRNTLESHCNV